MFLYGMHNQEDVREERPMKKLTVREKYLVFLALITMMIGMGYYLMELPSEAALMQARTENQLVRAEFKTSKRLLDEAGDKHQELEICRQRYQELSEAFDPVLSSYELERKVSYLLEQNHLDLVKAEIREPEPEYGSDKSQEPVFCKGIMNVKVTGSTQEFYNLLNEMENREDMIITSFTMSQTGGEELFNIEIVCYMLAEKTRLK